LKGENGIQDQLVALNILFDVLFKLTILMSPYVPFITDSFY
jgi:isoleucyl-tRNA synthetase